MARAARSHSFLARLLRFVLLLVVFFVLASAGAVITLRWLDPLTSTFILRDRVAAFIARDKDYHFRHQWVNRDRISSAMKLAVIASEDQKFAQHHGFDFDSIGNAWEASESGHRLRGASTLTQQVAKNLFLWPGQSWLRKGLEAYLTVLLETALNKQRILEIYLNSAEFGLGTFGVEAASEAYFHQPASRLTPYQAAQLAAVLPSPKRLRAQPPSVYVQARARWIVEQMQALGGPAYLSRLSGNAH